MDDRNNREGYNEHLGVNKLGKNIRKSPLHQPNYGNNNNNKPQPPQPHVYNISKNDFRNIVQQLTGSPSQNQPPPPPPRPPNNVPKPPSMRLQKIRPPPLTTPPPPPPPPGSSPGSDWAISAVPEAFIYVMHDIDCLITEFEGNYLDHVFQQLGSCPSEVRDLIKHSIVQGGKVLNDVVPRIMDTMTESLIEKSKENLRQLKGITATYMMTNKPLPVRHSPYASGVLRPLKVFLEGEQAKTYMSAEARRHLLQRATEEITGSYYEQAAELVNEERKRDFKRYVKVHKDEQGLMQMC